MEGLECALDILTVGSLKDRARPADAQLRADCENLQRAMDRLPPEIVLARSGRRPEKSRGQDAR